LGLSLGVFLGSDFSWLFLGFDNFKVVFKVFGFLGLF
jgi:hypothetical protein